MSELRYYPDSLLAEIDEARAEQQLPAMKRDAPRIAKSGDQPAAMNYLGAIDHLMYYAICMSLCDETLFMLLCRVGTEIEDAEYYDISLQDLKDYLSSAPKSDSIESINRIYRYLVSLCNELYGKYEEGLANYSRTYNGGAWIDRKTIPNTMSQKWTGVPRKDSSGNDEAVWTYDPPLDEKFYEHTISHIIPITSLDSSLLTTPEQGTKRSSIPYILSSYNEFTRQLDAFIFPELFPILTENVTYNAESITHGDGSPQKPTQTDRPPSGAFIYAIRTRYAIRHGDPWIYDVDYNYYSFFEPITIQDVETLHYLGFISGNDRTFASEVGTLSFLVEITVTHEGLKEEQWREGGTTKNSTRRWKEIYKTIKTVAGQVSKQESTSTGYTLSIKHNMEELRARIMAALTESGFSIRNDTPEHTQTWVRYSLQDRITIEITSRKERDVLAIAYCNSPPNTP